MNWKVLILVLRTLALRASRHFAAWKGPKRRRTWNLSTAISANWYTSTPAGDLPRTSRAQIESQGESQN